MRHFFGGRAFSQTDKITCEYSLFVLHPEHSHCFFRWESACWWARSVTWEIYDLHPSQESIKEKITLTSSKVCLNTTYEGNHTYSSTTILTECVLYAPSFSMKNNNWFSNSGINILPFSVIFITEKFFKIGVSGRVSRFKIHALLSRFEKLMHYLNKIEFITVIN